MAEFEILISNGMVVSGRGVRMEDIAVAGERIAAVGDLGTATADRVIDAQGRYVLPGVIDAHNHPVYADDLAAMSTAGAAGGVTTVVPYIGAIPAWGFPAEDPVAVVADYISQWDSAVACDFALHVAIDSSDDLGRDIAPLIELGISSFKFFMAYAARGMMLGDEELIRNFELVARHGAIAAVHAENGAGIAFHEAKDWDGSDVSNARFLECHTDLFETEAIIRAIALADSVGCPIYIPHIAVAEGLDAARLAIRAANVPVWLETCTHYLLLSNKEVIERGALSKIAPPLRNEHDNQALWNGVADGTILVVGTDHAGRTRAMKAEGGNILRAPYGAEGIEHLLPLIFSEGVMAGRIPITRMVEVLSEAPADIFGLSPRKGRLVPGADADIVVLDPRPSGVCSVETHVGNSDYCLYEGWRYRGSVTTTMRRGQILFEDGAPVGDQTGGRYLALPPLKRGEGSQDGIATDARPTGTRS